MATKRKLSLNEDQSKCEQESDINPTNSLRLKPFLDDRIISKLTLGLGEDYEFAAEIGRGTYGRVYKMKSTKKEGEYWALKISTRGNNPQVLENEFRVLKTHSKNFENLITLVGSSLINGRLCLLMEYFEHDDFRDFLATSNYNDKIEYMLNLMAALSFLHTNRVIHRDVKPSNFLVNRKLRKYRLIDFGLSQSIDFVQSIKTSSPRKAMCLKNETQSDSKSCMCIGKNHTCAQCREKPHQIVDKAGTSGYRAPEILFRSGKQGTPVDIFAAGVVLFSMLAKRYPILKPSNDEVAINELAFLFGTNEMIDAAEALNKKMNMQPEYPGIHLVKFCLLSNKCAELNDCHMKCESCAFCELHMKIQNIVQLSQYTNVNKQCICKTNSERGKQSVLYFVLDNCLLPNMQNRWTAAMVFKFLADYITNGNKC